MHGQPHADSDVDFLGVMPTRNQFDQAFKIHWAIKPPFPLHLVVRTPKNLAWRLGEGESFLMEVMTKGKVLYEMTGENACKRPAEGAVHSSNVSVGGRS